jgi:hypothetical protein
VYYHCTGNRGKCPEPYTRQEVLTSEFANILRELVIPQPILKWLGDAVLTSDQTEQAARAQTIKKLQTRYDQIQSRIETMYVDKLDGRVTQDFFDKQSATWRQEQDSVLRKIQDIQKATPVPIDEAIDMLRLTSRTSELFLQQPAAEQRRLLQVVIEKAAWQGGMLQTTLFEPFEILRHSNQENYRKEKEKSGSGRELEVWLPKNTTFQLFLLSFVNDSNPSWGANSPLLERIDGASLQRRNSTRWPSNVGCRIGRSLGAQTQTQPFRRPPSAVYGKTVCQSLKESPRWLPQRM